MNRALVGVLAAAVVSLALRVGPAHAQITLDGTLGSKRALAPVGGRFTIDAADGQIRGGNLFHSFGVFNVQTGQRATFASPTPVDNVIGRVTGGKSSLIDGQLGTTIPGANLYLLNPAGVLFGPNATLSVDGSFHVSTADALRFANGDRFFVDPGRAGGILSVANPRAFGFLGATPAGITVDRSHLHVPDGQTLSIVGGDLRIVGRVSGEPVLQAAGGRINLVSVGRVALPGVPGDVALPDPVQPAGATLMGFARLGRVEITQARTTDTAAIDASGDAGGTVLARGAHLEVDRARIFADTLGEGDGAPIGIDLRATDEIAIRRGAQVGTFAGGGGRGGDVRLAAEAIRITGAIADTLTFGGGNAGDVALDAGTVSLMRGARVGSASGSGGAAGHIAVTAAQSITVAGRDGAGNGSAVASTTEASGGGGSLAVSAPVVTLDDGGTLQSLAFGTGRGADIAVSAGQLDATRGGLIESVAVGRGDGGRVTVTATGTVTFSGSGSDDRPSGIFTSGRGDSRAGSVALDVGRLVLADGALVQSGTAIVAQGGDMSIVAREAVSISGGSSLASNASRSNVRRVEITTPFLLLDDGTIKASTSGGARAGDVILTVDRLELTRGGQVVASTELLATGRGGDVVVNATEAVSVSGRSAAGVASGLFSTASSVPPPGQQAGAAGRITVNAPVLAIADGGTISVATQNAGRAGDIVLRIGTLSLDGGARIDSSTAAGGQGGTVTVTATDAIDLAAGQVSSNATGTGAGGNIDLSASRISLADGAQVSATSTGTGDAGNISITARTAFVSQSSTVTTGATLADGGDITLAIGMLLHLVDSQISATVGTGAGGGGNIAIDPVFVILNGSEVRADAFGGPGGNIDIVAGTFLTSASAVSASSALGVQGTIDVSAGVTDVSGAAAPLPAALLQAAALLSESCATRTAAGKNSTLVVRARDGVPPEPGGAVLSNPIVAGAGEPRRAPSGPARGVGSPARLALVRLRCGGS